MNESLEFVAQPQAYSCGSCFLSGDGGHVFRVQGLSRHREFVHSTMGDPAKSRT